MDSIHTRETLFVTVLLPLNLHKPFTYRVPFELNAEIVVGKRVVVPFGKNKTFAGIIVEIHDVPPKQYEAKYLIDLIDDNPIVSEEQLNFWRWIAHYYMCKLGQVMHAALPAGLKMEGESKLILHPDFSWQEQTYDEREIMILQLLENQREVKISQLAQALKLPGVHRYIKSLYMKEAVLILDDIKQRFKPKKIKMIALAESLRDEQSLNGIFDQLEKRAPKQLEALMHFMTAGTLTAEIPQKQLVEKGSTTQAIQALVSKGVFVSSTREISRLHSSRPHLDELTLSKAQKGAYEGIKNAFDTGVPCLLHGITSSGKTLIYTQLIREYLDRKKQVLYLLPEIALTSQLLDRLSAFFGDQLVISHSKFSSNERVEVYHKIMSGDPVLIIGTRSAIFHPFRKLGLVIVDEEHESSFKQHEPAPRFHARDAILYLSKKLNAQVLLGSATPSYESYYNALNGKYQLVELHERYDDAALPEVVIVDMKEQKHQKRAHGVFSDTLLNALQEAKSAGKQSILFQNKKGYVPVLECTQCSWAPQCVNCDITLTYYKYQNNLRCHYCGYTRPTVTKCAACGHNGLELIGYGTERIEDELKLYAPDLITQRLDYNTTRSKSSHKKIIDAFAAGKIDVLIGTQMVAKGLDFDRVQLVGIMNADHLLNFPDFRAYERSYQLMTQVAGRAGRRAEQGKVYIQSSKADHAVLHHVKEHLYKDLYTMELVERNQFSYPPTSRLIRISLKHKNALKLHQATHRADQHLKQVFGNQILGPEKPHVGKIRNWYLMNFLLKLKNQAHEIRTSKMQLQAAVDLLEQEEVFKGIRFSIDVDPL